MLAIVGTAVADGDGIGEGEVLGLSVGDGLGLGVELSEVAGVGLGVGVGLDDAVDVAADVRLADAFDALAVAGPNREMTANANPTVETSRYRRRMADFNNLFNWKPPLIGPCWPDSNHLY